MNRRLFIQKCGLAVAAVAAGLWTTGKKVTCKIFRHAERTETYPGRLRKLENPSSRSPWSG